MRISSCNPLTAREPAVACNATHRENDAIAEMYGQSGSELGQLTDERTLNVASLTLVGRRRRRSEINKIKPGQMLANYEGSG